MTHTQIIACIMFGAGLLGGITNFFLLYDLNCKKNQCWINFLKSVSLSISASLTVPLFLQIISNNLIEYPKYEPFPEKNYFILSGFCVLASFYSKRFLDDLYIRVNKVEQKADEAIQIAENNEQKNQEIDNIDDLINQVGSYKSALSDFSKDEVKSVLLSIIASKYIYRTIKGISKDANLSVDKVTEILEFLKINGYSDSKKNKNGNDIWKINLKV